MIPNEKLRRLGLGTVQFGQAYGISNTSGQVATDEVARILARAARCGFGTLDTAAGYGEAESVLGALADATKPFRIVTKTIGLKNGLEQVIAHARRSVEILKRRPVDLLLVHSAGDLRGADGPALWRALQDLRDEGLFKAIGISAYVADDPLALAKEFRPAAMQLPISLLDQRLIASGALQAIRELGIGIHARSIFLQGLLFLAKEKLPPKLQHVSPQLSAVRNKLAHAGLTPLEGALAFAFQRPEIDVALVGVTSHAELDQIIQAAGEPIPQADWGACALNDEIVLTPSSW